MDKLWSIQTMEYYTAKIWGEILWPKWEEIKWHFILLNAKRKLKNHRYIIKQMKQQKTKENYIRICNMPRKVSWGLQNGIHQTVIFGRWEELSFV